MKNAFLLFTLLFLAIPTKGFAQDGLWTDEGNYNTSWYDETVTEFTLTTPAQLAGLAKLVNDGNGFYGKTVKLGADIDLGAHCWWPIGDRPAAAFKGIFDGQRKYIRQLKMTGNHYADIEYIALFGSFTGNLYNLNMDNSCLISPESVMLGAYVSSMIGNLYKEDKIPSVIQCSSMAILKSSPESNIGGIIAFCLAPQVQIVDCTNYSDIDQGWICGGIIAILSATRMTISNCHNYGNISAQLGAGGIIANTNGNINIEYCTNEGNISLYREKKSNVGAAGGIIAETSGGMVTCHFISCTNKGKIVSATVAGGIAGKRGSALKFDKCVNTGDVTAKKYAGGIAAGGGDDTFIYQCSNWGNVKASCSDYSILSNNDAKVYAAGICSLTANCINCSNYGEISAVARSVGEGASHVYVICNGICGLGNAYNCFNRGNLYANCHLESTSDDYVCTGILSLSGIIDLGNANNSYNSGNLTHNYYVKKAGYTSGKYISGISANHLDVPIVISNCYYSNEGIDYTLNGGTKGFTPFSEMQTQAFVDKLNSGRVDFNGYKADAWILDYNDGTLPNFSPTITSILNVERNNTSEKPLFTQTIVSTYAQLNMEISDNTEIDIYDFKGILIDKVTIDTNHLDVSQYANGTYIVIVKGENTNNHGKIIIKH